MSKNVLYAVLGFVAGGLIAYALSRNSDFEINVEGPNGAKVSMAVAGGAVDYETVLEALFADPFLRPAARDWLARTQSTTSIRDTRLAELLETGSCESIPTAPLRDRLEALRDCAQEPANSALRRLALEDRGYPFHPVGSATRVSVPQEVDWPDEEEASVCAHDYLGRRLELVHLGAQTPVFVTATQQITECSSVGIGTEMHLHPVTARKVFGHTLRGIDTVFVVPVTAN